MSIEQKARIAWTVGQVTLLLAMMSAFGVRVWPFPPGWPTGIGFFVVAVICFLLMLRFQKQANDDE